MQATSSNDETFNSKIFSNSAPEGEFFFEANVILSTRPLPPPLILRTGTGTAGTRLRNPGTDGEFLESSPPPPHILNLYFLLSFFLSFFLILLIDSQTLSFAFTFCLFSNIFSFYPWFFIFLCDTKLPFEIIFFISLIFLHFSSLSK